MEGFFKELVPQKINIYERNYQNFNQRVFDETLTNMNWDKIQSIDENDQTTLLHTKNSRKKNTNLDLNPG